MKKNRSLQWKNCIGLLLLLLICLPLRVQAEEGAVTLGSAEYSPAEQEEFSIGVYIQCGAPRYIYDVSVRYDPARMEYLGGADGGGDGVLRFVGESLEQEKKYMLTFRALEEGEAAVSVTEASVITNPVPPAPAEGEEGEAAQQPAQAPEVVAVTQMGSASVRVQKELQPGLASLTIEEFPDFALQDGVYEYMLDAEPETEKLTVNARPRDNEARVTISETALRTGENQIRITVETGEENRVYTLRVNRPEAEPEEASDTASAPALSGAVEDGTDLENGEAGIGTAAGGTETETRTEDTGYSAPSGGADSADGSGRHGNQNILMLIAALCFLAVVFGITLALIFRRRRREDEEDYLDEGMEEEWLDLDDGKWKKWLEKMDEEDDDSQEEIQQEIRNESRKERPGAAGEERMSEAKLTAEGGVKLAETEAKLQAEGGEKQAETEAKLPAGGGRKQAETEAKPAARPEPAAEKPASVKPEPAVPAEAAGKEQPSREAGTAGADSVIRVQDVSMRFKISEANAGSLKEYLLATVKRQNRYHELRALDHISFEIAKGEVVGIVGTNGSGKSTLLKLIAGAMKPTEGEIDVDRRKVQLLTLGTGFDTELTARENVYLNGAIIGYSREFIDENYDRIVEFAELNGFMDEKIKNFSSGMVSRLGFAIATVGESPEILILDEVLSVGDMFFRKKSEKRIKEMIHGGSTVLIVSHSTDVILKNCTKAVWIEKGVLREIGEPKKVCEAYRKQAG